MAETLSELVASGKARPVQSTLVGQGGLGEALLSGAIKNPFIRPFAQEIAISMGVPRKQVEQLEETSVANGGLERAAELIGEFGPDFLFFGGFGGLGRAGARAALQRVALNGARARGAQLEAVAQRALRDQAIKRGGTAFDPALLQEIRQPLIERAIEAVGMNAGFAGGEALRSALDDDPLADVVKQAGIVFALGLALEGGLVGIGRLSGRGRFIDLGRRERRNTALDERMAREAEVRESAPTAMIYQLVTGKEAPLKFHSLQELDLKLQGVLQSEAQLRQLHNSGQMGKRPFTKNLKLLEGQKEAIEEQKRITGANVAARRQALGQRELGDNPITDRPYSGRGGFTGTLLTVGREVGLTPEGLKTAFGAQGAAALGSAERAFRGIELELTKFRGDIETSLAAVSKLFGRAPEKLDKDLVLIRALHEIEQRGGTREKLIDFLMHPPTETVAHRGGATSTINWAEKFKPLTREKAELVAGEYEMLARRQLDLVDQVHRKANTLAPMTPKELDRMKVSRHFTHVAPPGKNDREVFEAMRVLYGDGEASRILEKMQHENLLASQRRAAGIERRAGSRLRSDPYIPIGKFGTFDHRRTIRGTAWEKHTQGVMIHTNPWEAMNMAATSGIRRKHIVEVVGTKGELIRDFRDAVFMEALAANRELGQPLLQRIQGRLGSASAKGTPVEAELNAQMTAQTFQDLFYKLIDNQFYPNALVRMAKTFTSVNVASKLTLAPIANLFQSGNNVFTFGLFNTMRGLQTLVTGTEGHTGRVFRQGLRHTRHRRELEQGLAIIHTTTRAMSDALESGLLSVGSERVANAMMRWTGFEATEKMNRVFSAVTARAAVMDDIVQAANGRLRGARLDGAIRRNRDLGVDLKREVERFRSEGTRYFDLDNNQLTATMLENASFAGAQKTQFIPSRFRRPNQWNHPVGRILFQFKTFALGQGRLIRDQVFAELAQGNLAPFAAYLAITPASGAAISLLRQPFTERELDDNPLVAAVQATIAAGGFALAGDAITSMVHGRVLELGVGPTFATLARFAENLVQLDSDGLVRIGTSLPISRATLKMTEGIYGLGKITSQTLDDYLQATDPVGTPVMSGGEAALSSGQNKSAGPTLRPIPGQ